MSNKFKLGIGICASALALAFAAGTATSASAHPITEPVPTPASTPYGHHHVRAVPWLFDLQLSSIGGLAPGLNVAVNNVDSGRAGIIMRNWQDDQTIRNPFVSRFFRGPNSVTLLHDIINVDDLDVNLYTCTVRVNHNGNFRILNGTGTGAGFRSINGQYVENGIVSYDLVRVRDRDVCPLVFLSTPRLVHVLLGNLNIGPNSPSFFDFNVQARAGLLRVAPVHVFTPTATPSDSLSA